MTNLCEIVSYRQHLLADSHQRQVFRHLHSHGSFVEKLGFSCELQGHSGCVNCLQWNSNGNLLASGSDDTSAILWDPYQRKAVATMQTGHTGNIFSVKFLPFSGDKMLITGSEDGEVRLHDLTTFDTTQIWSCSQGRVKRVAVSPDSPFLCWSASEDGCVRRLDSRERHTCAPGGGACRNVLIDLSLHPIRPLTPNHVTQCKCIDINPVRSEQIAVGALDAYARIYDARLCTPHSPEHSRGGGARNSASSDPSCIAIFSPGHLSANLSMVGGKRSVSSTVAATYVSFSADGQELLVNLSGEQVYLYDTTNQQLPIAYDFDMADGTAVPEPKPTSRRMHAQCRSGVFGSGTRLGLTASHSSSNLKTSVEESEVEGEVIRLKDLGKQLYKEERLDEALSVLNMAIAICPNWHLLYFLRGTALYSRKWSGDVYAALRDVETSLSLHPTHKLSQQRRIQCLMDLGMSEEAKRFLHNYKQKHANDSKFVNRTAQELKEKTKKDTKTSASNGFHASNGRSRSHSTTPHQQQVCDYQSRFCGHCNTHTDIKEAVFIGDRGNYVAAGSDDGNIFIWEKRSGRLVRALRGDSSIVNCVQWNPATPMLATSGIENAVRLWEPGCLELESDPGPVSESDPGQADVGLSPGRVVSDLVKVCKDNQHRMGVDPFEVMLMRMGFRLAMAEAGGGEGGGASNQQGEGPVAAAAAEDGNRGTEEPMDEEGVLRWVDNPANCRQS